jgi:NitT/TauT family transport system substrate-binding protein
MVGGVLSDESFSGKAEHNVTKSRFAEVGAAESSYQLGGRGMTSRLHGSHHQVSTVSRRAVIATIFATIALSLLAVGASAASPAKHQKGQLKEVSFRFDVTASGYDAPFLLAAKKGWYAAKGLHVNFGEGNGSSSTVQLVNNGQDTFGWADFGTMSILVDQGAQVRAVSVIGQQSPVGVITLADSPVHTLKDLYGKRLLVNPRGASAPLLRATFTKQGLDLSQVSIVNTSADVTNDQLLAQHRVDAFVGWQTFELPGLPEVGVVGRIMPFRTFGVNVLNVCIVAASSTIANDRTTVRSFVQASLKGWEYAAKHPAEAVKVLTDAYPNVKANVALGQLTAQVKLFHTANSKNKPIGWTSPKDVTATQQTLFDTGLIKTKRAVVNYFDDEFIPAIKATKRK